MQEPELAQAKEVPPGSQVPAPAMEQVYWAPLPADLSAREYARLPPPSGPASPPSPAAAQVSASTAA